MVAHTNSSKLAPLCWDACRLDHTRSGGGQALIRRQSGRVNKQAGRHQGRRPSNGSATCPNPAGVVPGYSAGPGLQLGVDAAEMCDEGTYRTGFATYNAVGGVNCTACPEEMTTQPGIAGATSKDQCMVRWRSYGGVVGSGLLWSSSRVTRVHCWAQRSSLQSVLGGRRSALNSEDEHVFATPAIPGAPWLRLA